MGAAQRPSIRRRWDPMNTTALLRTLIVLMSACLCAASASAQQKKAAASPTDQAVLLGQFGDWGAYRASPGGKKVCFALSKPTSAATERDARHRVASYAVVATRPSEKLKNEVSVIVGYPQKPGHDATAAIGSAHPRPDTANTRGTRRQRGAG